MKTEMKRPVFLTMFLISSCASGTKYKPSIYGHDYRNREIITPVTHERIYCGTREFNKFASVRLEDLTKLALILKYAKVPRKVRLIVENFRKEVAKRNKQNKTLMLK
jgi:hypothetical protein